MKEFDDETLTCVVLAKSALFSDETSHVERIDSSDLKKRFADNSCHVSGGIGEGVIGLASRSSVLSSDGTLHVDTSDNSALETDPQMTLALSQEEAVGGEIVQAPESSILPLDGTTNFERHVSTFFDDQQLTVQRD